jgi:hypothetical protein
VEMGLWDAYSYYIVGSSKESEKILKENKKFEISERDAVVIGLLKTIHTDNLIHVFNQNITHFLTVKSMKEKDSLLVRKKSTEIYINKFLNKYPDYWEPSPSYKKSLIDLKKYIDDLKIKISKLEIFKISFNGIEYELYNSNSVKKLLTFNYH